MRFTYPATRSFGLIELLVSLVIISVLSYISLRAYFKKPLMDASTERVLSEHGIDSSSSQALIQSTKNKVEEINKKQAESQNIIDNLNK